MRTFIEGSVSRYESRQMTRRKLVGSLSVLSAIVLASSLVLGQSRDAVAPIPVSTLNHVSLPTSYNQCTVMWRLSCLRIGVDDFEGDRAVESHPSGSET